MKTLLALLLSAASAHAATFVMAVGISKYQHLPQDLWLQYPDRDAESFVKLLQSARAGDVASNRTLVLTNEHATTAAIRKGFDDFLKLPGKDDTVYILIAGHGTVDSRGAYILTYDAAPDNLSATALSMGEIRSLVEREVTRAGHVVFLADVCRAASIEGQKSTAIGAVVEKLGETPGEMLGLMAARPTELSLESPEFGGGHGAFTWSVLRALDGAADRDHDGFVTAGELIDFVTQDVRKMTDDKQHPRDFGNMDDGLKLADTSKPGIPLP